MLTSLVRLMEKLSGLLLGGAAVGSQVGTIFICVIAVALGQATALSLLSR